MQPEVIECDVLIIGGGLVGSALALALTQLPLRVVLVESHDVAAPEQPGFDARATALANGTRRILESLSLWHGIAPRAEPITRIHISERGRFGAARITAEAERVDALGYTIENRELGSALWSALRSVERFRVLAPARFLDMTPVAHGLAARIAAGDIECRVKARVLVAADGARSGVREMLDLGVRRIDYRQSAVIFNCLPRRPLSGLAFERFAPEGPLALLPLPDDRAGVVWSVGPTQAQELLELDGDSLSGQLDQALGGRLGPIDRVGERACFALHRVCAAELRGPRTVLLGSAAVNLHPVAGQGFNLAMRDIACLAEVFAEELCSRRHDGDIGAAGVLAHYANWRRRDQASVAALTHSLIRLFGLRLPGAGHARGLGLLAFDLWPGAKRLFARYAMGRAGRVPRLVCGQPLPLAEPPYRPVHQ